MNHQASPERTRAPPTMPLSSESLKARLFLAVACLWPLMLLALLASSATPQSEAPVDSSSSLRLTLRNALDRVDIMGYGPTHPRIAMVVVGDDAEAIVTTVKSVISHTDLSRIFVVTVVVEGKAEDPALERQLREMEEGSIPHWHGARADVHTEKQQEEHSRKVHVIFNAEKLGLAASREDAVDFCHMLAQYHEEAGLKSHAEDLILLLMEAGSQIVTHKWLTPVTRALIVPPPLLPASLNGVDQEASISLKMANAVIFPVQGMDQGQLISLDLNLAPVLSLASAEELNGSSGDSYMSHAWDGVAMALRLETYRNLPLPQAVSATDEDWSSNLDVALALWLCADGMDVLSELQVQRSPKVQPAAGLSPASASRFAAAWMDDVVSGKFFNVYQKEHTEVTALEWNLWHAQSDAVWRNSRPHCRSFEWYIENVNPDMRAMLREDLIVDANPQEVIEKANEQKDTDEKPVEVELVDVVKKEEDLDANSVAIPKREEPKKPSKPLCEECLNIVQKARPISLDFVDASNGNREHPHLGAKDALGNLGYVHDETHLHSHPPPFAMPKQDLAKACARRDNHYRMLTEKVHVDFQGEEEAEKSGKVRAKIFCLVYTTEKNHDRIPRIRETWGQKCDGFMVGSTKTDPSIDTVEIPHEGPEEYNNIWQKVRSMWAYIYDNYYEKYDWFRKCNTSNPRSPPNYIYSFLTSNIILNRHWRRRSYADRRKSTIVFGERRDHHSGQWR